MPVPPPATPGRAERRDGTAIPRRVVHVGMLAMVTWWITGCSPTPDERENRPRPPSGPDSPASGAGSESDLADLGVLSATLANSVALDVLAQDVLDQASQRNPAVVEVERVLSIQTAVLSRLVQAGSIPSEDSSAESTSESPGDEDTQTAEATPNAVSLTQMMSTQSSTAVVGEELATVSAANIATLMSLHGSRRACVEVLSDQQVSPTLSGPAGAGAITALAGLRQCQYGLQVLAARSEDGEQATYLEALGRLRSATQQLTELAGSAAPAAPLGYGIPSDINTVRQRRALAQQLLRAAAEAVIAGSAARSGDASAIDGTVSLVSLVAAVGESVGVPLSGFPGMTVPAADS
ncbi:MAG: hypothetical protein WA991_15230 [Ornithinimicrobium sp.]